MAAATVAGVDKTAHPFDKANLEALLSRRFFYAPAFEIYGGANAFSSPHADCSRQVLITHVNQVSPAYTIMDPPVHPSRPI